MKVEKEIISTEEVDIKIKEVTLLSVQEYMDNKSLIPQINGWWWLKSPGYNYRTAANVNANGALNSTDICNASGGVRPALKVYSLKETKLNPGDKVDLCGLSWTVLNNNIILCDKTIGNTYFRSEWKLPGANIFDTSDVKKWTENWAEAQNIEITTNK